MFEGRLLKGNISTMVGGLYKKEGKMIRRDLDLYLLRIGINIGAATAALLVGYVGETIGGYYGFGLAGIRITLGQVSILVGTKIYNTCRNIIQDSKVKTNSKINLVSEIFKKTNSIIGFFFMTLLSLIVYYIFGAWDFAHYYYLYFSFCCQ